jgi:hypothetical protein
MGDVTDKAKDKANDAENKLHEIKGRVKQHKQESDGSLDT